ncbi:MAG: HDOD domain-containing protein [Desulfopila sp.]|jgi:EAL and modified HD-GYP domain-containing signal transduction protein|nr:HDOD domain-containing protein [Desulfopila sp.]
MDFFLARQPIFNVNKRVFAYELLYRGATDTSIKTIGGSKATTSLLTSVFLTEGIDKISNSKPCFINFTRDLLVRGIPLTFSKSQIVVEVLEDVPPDPEVLVICEKLRKKGYIIALDDFVYDSSLDPLIALADIIKLDFRALSADEILKTMHRLSRFKLKFLAEKVETTDEFEKAAKLGFAYYQGFFFSKPELLTIKELTAVKLNLLHMLAELSREDWSVQQLTDIITKDVALTYKILRYLNSSYFYRLQKIESVVHAISYLGEKEIRRFAVLAIISEIAANKPEELINLAMTRARFCELLAEHSAAREFTKDIFILGLFSTLDAMLDMPMSAILEKLPLAKNLHDGLATRSGPYAVYLNMVLAYEHRQKKECLESLRLIGPLNRQVHELYLESVSYAQQLLRAAPG